MQVSFIHSIHQVDPADWDSLWPDDYPFTRHAFFAALEDSGSTCAAAGWEPYHALLKNGGQLVGAAPLYKKTHSYGEYVFDWAWADAYAQYGLNYYPKLVNAVPFTPATGPRLGLVAQLQQGERAAAVHGLHTAIVELAQKRGYSGWHCLFPDAQSQALLTALPLTLRYGYQFHWFNQGYVSFDDFLSSFNSRKRKNLKKERTRVEESGLTLRIRTGAEVGEGEWNDFYTLYQATYLKRSGGGGYLGPSFFARLADAMPEQLILVSAHPGRTANMVAAAFYLRDEKTLYGRYWGALEEYDGLHFEACYYRGIEYAIAERLKRFDPGAQGEHKIQRGFTPIATCSYHWLADSRFANAIGGYCQQEAAHIIQYISDARSYLPFRAELSLPPATALMHPRAQTLLGS